MMAVNNERTHLIRIQTKAVMPLIGGLLDAWADLPNDVKSDPELDSLKKHIDHIDNAMETGGRD